MYYYLLKLRFKTPVHFGADVPGIGIEKSMLACHADTLFSSLCHEAFYLYGEEGIQYLVEKARTGEMLVSDLLPYRRDDLYVPRPLLSQEAIKVDPSLKKKLKKVNYIRVSEIQRYTSFLENNDETWVLQTPTFGVGELVSRVAIKGLKAPLPYLVGVFKFEEGAGLYVILGTAKEEDLAWYRSLFDALGYAGIGGKRTSGLGFFEVEDVYDLNDPQFCYTEDEVMLAKLLHDSNKKRYMTLSAVCPKEDEWEVIKDERSSYSLIQRRGFIQSQFYHENLLKRRPLIMIGPGSVFPAPLKGRIVDTGKEGAHPVYRYGKAMMIGVVV